MYKGIVIKVTKEYAVVLAEENQYCRVISKDGLYVGQKIFFFQEDLIEDPAKEEHMASPTFWKKAISFSVMAASLLFFFLFGNMLGLPGGNNAYYAVVSVDINPSIEMKLNKARYVTQVGVLNQEGYQVAGQYLVGLKLEEAVSLIVEKAAKYNYLVEQDTILLSASVNTDEGILKENFTREMTEELSKADLPGEYTYLYLPAEQEEYLKAKEKELSLGKYEMMVLAKDTIEAEQVKKMKVKELLEEKELQLEFKDKKSNNHFWLEGKSKKAIRDKVKIEKNNRDNNNRNNNNRNNDNRDNNNRNNDNRDNDNRDNDNRDNDNRDNDNRDKDNRHNDNRDNDNRHNDNRDNDNRDNDNKDNDNRNNDNKDNDNRDNDNRHNDNRDNDNRDNDNRDNNNKDNDNRDNDKLKEKLL